MMNLSHMKKLGRAVRCDDWPTLGQATPKLIVKAIDEQDYDTARALAEYIVPEGKGLHDLFCDWVWDLLSKTGELHGEEAVYNLCRATQETWMMKRTWKALSKMSVEERVYLNAEIMRSHLCGPEQDGEIEIVEEQDRISIKMDPCGSGGRMRRGDPVNGSGSRMAAPYSFGCTKKAYPWSWGKPQVPYYCIHCAINEILPIEWGGYPLWVTGYNEDESQPCYWHFYRRPELVPEFYFTRLGFEKPQEFQGV